MTNLFSYVTDKHLWVDIDGIQLVIEPCVEGCAQYHSKIVSVSLVCVCPAVRPPEVHEVKDCLATATRFFAMYDLLAWHRFFKSGSAIHFDSRMGGRAQIRGSCRGACSEDYPTTEITDEDYQPLPEAEEELHSVNVFGTTAGRAADKSSRLAVGLDIAAKTVATRNRIVVKPCRLPFPKQGVLQLFSAEEARALQLFSAEEARASLAAFRQEHPDIADPWKVVAEDRLECAHDEMLCTQQFMRETGMCEQPEIAVEAPFMALVDEFEEPQPLKSRRFLLSMIAASLVAHVALLAFICFREGLPIWSVL